ncbi:hypothetical protein BAX97_04285 [Elizabethkingia meningoseptica]|uniref:hypothetical protein n=1 Tax=Elizabethkingia meningoseptica TaxID=238 RepID=UPI0009997966|nr:hypothetical protein [Elizabethkingia meningoseptica]OPC33687.1 hypothetical protein BAX97_04285 [Elizabethkingia meningoseptica]
MLKFLAQKKKLLEDIFEKASNETTEVSFSGITKYLERTLKDDYKIQLSYKAFENYYKAIVKEENGDYNIKPQILDDLSKYLGYNTFKEYCSEWKTIEYSINHTISKIVIHIINKPLLTLPDFFHKKANLGIMGIILAGSLVGGFFYNKDKQEKPPKITLKETFCMYWAGDEYKITNCSDKDPHHNLKPFDSIQIKYFKRITQPDTLTPDNAMEKVWYSKLNNQVDFFTSVGTGTNPGNDAKLKPVTPLIIEKYAHENK